MLATRLRNPASLLSYALQIHLGRSPSYSTAFSISDIIWECGPLLSAEQFLGDKDSLKDAYSTMQRLRDCKLLLEQLLASVDSILAPLKDATYPAVLKNGINSMPDEVLALVLESTFHGEDPRSQQLVPLRLAGVSQRFRKLTMSMPILWTAIDGRSGQGNCTVPRISHFLALSRGMPLDVRIPHLVHLGWERNEHWESEMAPLMECIHLCNRLWITADYYNPEEVFVDRDLPPIPLLTFEHVEEVIFEPNRWVPNRVRHEYASYRLFINWEFPNAHTLQTFTVLPRPGTFKMLTNLRLYMRETDYMEEIHEIWVESPMDQFVGFLEATPFLADLLIDTEDIDWGVANNCVELHCLKVLQIRSRSEANCTPDTLQVLFEAFSAPSLEELSILITSLDLELMEDLVPDCLLPPQPFPELKRLRLEAPIDFPDSTAFDLLREFPTLKELELSHIRDVSFDTEREKCRSLTIAPGLRRLCMRQSGLPWPRSQTCNEILLRRDGEEQADKHMNYSSSFVTSPGLPDRI